MGVVLSDGLINTLNNSSPANQLVQLGTQLDNALAGILPTGSISLAELADSMFTADAAGRAKFVDQFVTAAKIANFTITTTQISATAAITGSQLAAAAAIVGTQLAANTVTPSNLSEIPFVATATLTAAAAATPVDIVATASVPTGKKIYITDILLYVNGATAWTDVTATVVTIQDKAGSPVTAVTAAKAQLTGSTFLRLESTGITMAAPVLTGVGLTASVGLTIKGDANFAAGSDIVCTVTGFIK